MMCLLIDLLIRYLPLHLVSAAHQRRVRHRRRVCRDRLSAGDNVVILAAQVRLVVVAVGDVKFADPAGAEVNPHHSG